MSWLARSLANSLMSAANSGDAAAQGARRTSNLKEEEEEDPVDPGTPSRGAKDDISELTKTLTRQLWSVASFLAPPPNSASEEPSSPSNSPRMAGIRSDFADIGGKFRSGFSMLSNARAMTEISKIASTFLPIGLDEEFDEEDEGFGAVGVSNEVVAFARDLSMHPETWLDFPLLRNDGDSDEFDMSDAQQEHALAVERLAPRLAALRIELCPSHMSEGCFWKIYFVLLHPRLDKNDAQLLSTPQIVEARAMLLKKFQCQTQEESEQTQDLSRGEDVLAQAHDENVMMLTSNFPPETISSGTLASEGPKASTNVIDVEIEKQTPDTTDVKIVDKLVIKEGLPIESIDKGFSNNTSNAASQGYTEDGDEWLEEDTEEMVAPGVTTIPFANDEDVSFSDLEEDDDRTVPRISPKVDYPTGLNEEESRDWVQLNETSGELEVGNRCNSHHIKEPNDWLNVEDFNVA